MTIEYYVKDGVNIATKLISDGDEKEPYGNQVRIKIKIRGQMMQVYSLFIFSASVYCKIITGKEDIRCSGTYN